jgi:iron-sulfur cluster assembly protein
LPGYFYNCLILITVTGMNITLSDKKIPVLITPKALSSIKALMEQKNISSEEYGLRVGMRGGGCGGASFLLGFDKAKDNDEAYMADDLPVFIEKKHVMYVLGLEIDFEEGEESGFTFNNPNAPVA